MICHFARTADGYQAWFALQDSSGLLRTGALSSAFTVTVIDPSDTVTNIPTVVESIAKPGIYRFTIPSAFLTANGVGEYGVVVEVNVPSPNKIVGVIDSGLLVTQESFDSLIEAMWDELIDGTVSAKEAVKYTLAMVAGDFTETTISPTITDFAFKDQDGNSLYTLRYTEDTSRVRTVG